MNDHEAVYQLYTRYAAGMDNRQFELTRETFATDASFSLNIKGTEAVAPIEGKQAVGDFIETTTREQTDQRRHVITNVRFSNETDTETRATAILSLFVTLNNQLTTQATGWYDCQAVLDDGTWRFARMYLTLDRTYES